MPPLLLFGTIAEEEPTVDGVPGGDDRWSLPLLLLRSESENEEETTVTGVPVAVVRDGAFALPLLPFFSDREVLLLHVRGGVWNWESKGTKELLGWAIIVCVILELDGLPVGKVVIGAFLASFVGVSACSEARRIMDGASITVPNIVESFWSQ